MRTIRAKLWIGMLALIFIMLILLWTLQIGFLDMYYQYAKMSEVKRSAITIDAIVKDGKLEDIMAPLERLAYENSLCIDLRPMSPTGAMNNASVSIDMLGMDCLIHSRQGGAVIIKEALTEFAKQGKKEYVATIVDPRFGTNSMLLVRSLKIGNEPYILLINTPLVPVSATKKILAEQLFIISWILLIFSIMVSFAISRSLTKPIAQISGAARKFAEGDFAVRVDVQSDDEIGQLADNFNYLAEEVGKVENSRKEMIASVSHDLRTPLTLIKGYAEMMRDLTGDNREKRDEQLNIIIEEADRLNLLVEDMLHVSRLQNSSIVLQKTEFDLAQSVRDIALHYEVMAEKMDFIFKLDLPPYAWVTADKARIEQVIHNLLNNAINHIGEDRVVGIDLTLVRNHYRVSVWDHGDGIAPEHQPLIWERYYRVDNSGKRKAMGTGLGLSIVRELLQLHDAAYGVQSELGAGSTFWFELDKFQ